MSFIEEGKGSCMISLHRRTLSNKTHVWLHKKQEGEPSQTAENPSTGSGGETGFFPLKFLTWQNFRKHNFSEITERRPKSGNILWKLKKKPTPSWGASFYGVWSAGVDTRAHEGWASTPSYPCYPKKMRVELTYIWFLLYLWNKLYMMEPPWSSAREAMSSTPSSFMGCIGVTFWWVIVLCL